MEKVIIILSTLLICSCNQPGNLKEDCKKDLKNQFQVNCVTYWEKNHKATTPMMLLRMDTTNFNGYSLRFDESGDTLEKVVILDHKSAIRISYYKKRPDFYSMCYYKLRRSHPTLPDYSLVCRDYGFRFRSIDDSARTISFVKGRSLDGPSIDFYPDMKVKSIVYFKDGEATAKTISFDSLTGSPR